MKLAGFQEFGKVHPVLDVIEAVGFVVGMSPQAGGLMAAAHFDEGIENELLFRRHLDVSDDSEVD